MTISAGSLGSASDMLIGFTCVALDKSSCNIGMFRITHNEAVDQMN